MRIPLLVSLASVLGVFLFNQEKKRKSIPQTTNQPNVESSPQQNVSNNYDLDSNSEVSEFTDSDESNTSDMSIEPINISEDL